MHVAVQVRGRGARASRRRSSRGSGLTSRRAALLTQMSMPAELAPDARRRARRPRRSCSCRRRPAAPRVPRRGSPPRSRRRRRATIPATSAPAAASATAIAWPMPLDAPVTTARRPVRSKGEVTDTTRHATRPAPGGGNRCVGFRACDSGSQRRWSTERSCAATSRSTTASCARSGSAGERQRARDPRSRRPPGQRLRGRRRRARRGRTSSPGWGARSPGTACSGTSRRSSARRSATCTGRSRRSARRPDTADGARILGAHLEGPFLSPARAGAHARSISGDPTATRSRRCSSPAAP